MGRGFFCYQYAAPQGLENKEHFLKSRRDYMLVETMLQKRRDFLNCYKEVLLITK